jgi:hypothetical protein
VSEGGYRDGRAGILEHLREAELAVAERNARVTPALLRILPDELGARLAELRAASGAADDSLEELTRVVEARAALLDALDEAIALGPSLAAELRDVPDGVPSVPPQDDPWGPAGTEAAMEQLLYEAQSSAWRLDPDAELTTSGARVVGRLTVDGVPLLWLVELGAWVNRNSSMALAEATVTFLRSKHVLEVNVPPALSRLVVRPRTLGDALRRLLHLDHGLPPDDSAFGRALFVEGDEAFARPLLTEPVKERLLACFHQRTFRLVVQGGVASVAWSSLGVYSHFEPEPLGSAARALLALRHSAESLELVRA